MVIEQHTPEHQWVKEVKKEIKKSHEMKENTIYQNLWDAAKSVLRCKLIVISMFSYSLLIVGNKKDLK